MEVREVNMEDMMFSNFERSFSAFNIIFIVASVFIALGFIFVILSIVSPKFRGKMLSRQVKATKHMVDYSKEDFEDIGTNLGNVAINTKKNILDQNEDALRDIANREANIKKGYVKTMVNAIHEGLTEEDTIYCKHCGATIDSDSKFCKRCGKEQ